MDSHRDLLRGGDTPVALGCRNTSARTGNTSSYTCNTDARRRVKVQTPPVLRTALPVDEETKSNDAILKYIVKRTESNYVTGQQLTTCQKTKQTRKTHDFLDSLSQFRLLLHHFSHLLEDSSGQLHVETLWISSHLTQELLVGEDAVAVEASVMGHALTTHGQLKKGTCER